MKYFVLMMLFLTSLMAAVNLNTASQEELTSVPGIGEKKAAAILKYRKQYGHFKHVNDLVLVKGFGDKSVAKLKSKLSVQ